MTGFPYDELDFVAELNEEWIVSMQKSAMDHRKGIVLPLLMKDGKKFVNRTHVISARGEILGHYDKIHLIGALNEDSYLTPGEKTLVLDLDFSSEGAPPEIWRTGFATCYDLRFPELFRKMVLEEGAQIILLPAFWPMIRDTHFHHLSIARAIENQCYFITCNSTGIWGRLKLCGNSMAVSPKGEILHQLSATDESFFDFTPNREIITKWRSEFPALEDAKKRKTGQGSDI